MTTRCKPGDLAFITTSAIPENIGKVVEILWLEPEATAIQGEPVWWTRSPTPVPLSDGSCGTDGEVEDARLHPITGLPIDEETREELTA